MKFVINKGKGQIHPTETDLVSVKVSLRVDNSMTLEKEYKNIQMSNLLNEEEKIILRSLKMNEKSNIEIENNLAYNIFSKTLDPENNEKICILYDLVCQFTKESNLNNLKEVVEVDLNFFMNKRFFYIIELNEFTECFYKKETIFGCDIYSSTLLDGLGSMCPWDNYKAWLLIKVKQIAGKDKFSFMHNKHNSKQLEKTSDDKNEENIVFSNYDDFFNIERIKDLKEKVTSTYGSQSIQINSYKQLVTSYNEFHNKFSDTKQMSTNCYDVNFKSNVKKKEELVVAYDSYSLQFPNFITNKLKTMKIFETIELQYSGTLDYLKITDQLEIIDDNVILVDGIKNESNNKKNEFTYVFEIVLLNFQDNKFVYNSDLNSSEVCKSLAYYKDLSNYYLNNGLLYKSVKINFNIVNETIRLVNLVNKGVHSDVVLKDNFELQDIVSKVHSNYINQLFKDKKFKECLDSIETFNEYYDPKVTFNEGNINLLLKEKFQIDKIYLVEDRNHTYIKVNFIKIKILKSFYDYKEAVDTISSLTKTVNNHYSTYDCLNCNLLNEVNTIIVDKYENVVKMKNVYLESLEIEKNNVDQLIKDAEKRKEVMIKKMFQFK